MPQSSDEIIQLLYKVISDKDKTNLFDKDCPGCFIGRHCLLAPGF